MLLLLTFPYSVVFISVMAKQQVEHFSYYRANSIDLSHENIGGISLGERDDNKVKHILIDKRYRSNDWFHTKNGVKVKIKNKEITAISCEVDHVNTQRNINLSSSLQDITKKYGQKYYKREEQGFNIIGYPDKKNKVNLEFWFLNHKLKEIFLEEDG
jgi:hypothetical protein